MNKKLLTLSVAVLAAAVLLAGNQTIKSLNKEDAKSESTTVNEISNSTPATVDSSMAPPSELKTEVQSVSTVENQSPAPSEKQSEEKKISAAEAEAIALEKSGFSASEVYDKEVDLDYEKGAWVYEVSFEKNYIDYEYIIDAVSGEVLYSKAEPENDYKSVPATKESEQPSADEKSEAVESRISAKEAEAIALKKAGFSASEVYDREVELDYERGSCVYDVSFEKDRTDYEYIIDAVSGEILHSEADID